MIDLDSMTLRQIEDRLRVNHEALRQMVGSLYPSIVRDEITQIESRLQEILQVTKNKPMSFESAAIKSRCPLTET